MPGKHQLVVLVVLDGWGVASQARGNAISLASTPNFDQYIQTYPAATLHASGELVGLPWAEMGNSEAGHLNIGAGRIFYQPLPRINKAISDGSFFKNKGFLQAFQHVKKNNSALHLMGLVSDGGVHSFVDHLYALLELCQKKKINRVFIHAFLDGRDTARDTAGLFIKQLQKKIKEIGVGNIATISGRFYAMDRDNHWDRTAKAYFAIAEGESTNKASDPEKAIRESYKKEIYDEEFLPTVITKRNKPITRVQDNDAMIFFNFRADRARQMTKAFTLPGFEKIPRKHFHRNLLFVTMMEYELELPVEVAFDKENVQEPLSKVLSDHDITQFHIAETEKYAHVTFFLNGGIEKAFSGEDRTLVPSPHVSSFDQAPEMAAKEIASRVIERILSRKYEFIVVNFANADMVGHTGNLKATVKAIEVLDKAIGDIGDAVLHSDGVMVVTGDHGNAEEMVHPQTGEIIKEHTTNPVPFLLVGKIYQKKNQTLSSKEDLVRLRPIGILADIAPTILSFYNISKPKCMEGRTLLPTLIEK